MAAGGSSAAVAHGLLSANEWLPEARLPHCWFVLATYVLGCLLVFRAAVSQGLFLMVLPRWAACGPPGR